MRVIIVHHGQLPGGDAPVTGGALRAWNHGQALLGAGHEVHYLHREQDGPGGFSSPADLARRAKALHPDRVICLQVEDAPALADIDCPVALDLYAPRLIEAPHQGRLAEVATQTLCALSAADVFLVSNPRQGYAWLGVLALAGIDIRRDPTLHIPLVAPEGPRRHLPEEPIIIGGGASWPWQDPRSVLEPVLEVLDRRGAGKIRWVGGSPLIGDDRDQPWTLPDHPRLESVGWMSYADLLRCYASATVALDTAPPSPERTLALRFRHVDYLGCGLPVICPPDSPLAASLGDAGWVGSDPAALVERALGDRDELRARSRAARQLARSHFGLAQCRALAEWIETPERRPRPDGPLLRAASLSARAHQAEAQSEAMERALERAEREVDDKRTEVAQLNERVRALIDSQQHLSHAIDEVAGFKREAVAVLDKRVSLAERSRQELERELALQMADNEKKTAELQAMDSLRERLEHDIENLRKEIHRLRQRGPFRRG